MSRLLNQRRRNGRRPLKASEGVALELLRDIVSARLKPGDRLPLESEMVLRYGMSRPSLREALRLLEFQGLIAIRPGPGSSTVVGKATASNLAQMLMLYFHLDEASYDELLSAWQMTEPLLARLAAENADRAAVQSTMLPFLTPESGIPPDEAHRYGTAFHDAVAKLAANKVLALVCHAIGAIAEEHLAHEGYLPGPPHLLDDHVQIARAIYDGEPDKAATTMAAHMTHIVAAFRERWPEKVGERRWI